MKVRSDVRQKNTWVLGTERRKAGSKDKRR